MSNAQKALVMAAGIFLAIALITIAVIIFGSAQDATKTAQDSFSDIQTELSQTSLTVYDGTTMSGSAVMNAIRKFSDKNEFGIQVVTGKNKQVAGVAGEKNNVIVRDYGSWYNYAITYTDATKTVVSHLTQTGATGSLEKALSQGNDDYINPSGKFKSQIVYDSSRAVRGIIFIQG